MSWKVLFGGLLTAVIINHVRCQDLNAVIDRVTEKNIEKMLTEWELLKEQIQQMQQALRQPQQESAKSDANLQLQQLSIVRLETDLNSQIFRLQQQQDQQQLKIDQLESELALLREEMLQHQKPTETITTKITQEMSTQQETTTLQQTAKEETFTTGFPSSFFQTEPALSHIAEHVVNDPLQLHVFDQSGVPIVGVQVKGDMRFLTVVFNGTGEFKAFAVKECSAYSHENDFALGSKLPIVVDRCYDRGAGSYFRRMEKYTTNPAKQLLLMGFTVFKFKYTDSVTFNCIISLCRSVDDPVCATKACNGGDRYGRRHGDVHSASANAEQTLKVTIKVESTLPTSSLIAEPPITDPLQFYIAEAGDISIVGDQVKGDPRFLTVALNSQGEFKDFAVKECTAYSNENDFTVGSKLPIVVDKCVDRGAISYFRRIIKNRMNSAKQLIQMDFTIFRFKTSENVTFNCIISLCRTVNDPVCAMKSCNGGEQFGLRRRRDVPGENAHEEQTVKLTVRVVDTRPQP